MHSQQREIIKQKRRRTDQNGRKRQLVGFLSRYDFPYAIVTQVE